MLERMKLSTHQYARSQIKWIRKQLLPAVKEAKALGGDVDVYVVRGGEDEPGVELLQRESAVMTRRQG
jgi:tRNA dimethylallyltransferase